jgi:hypothetical protein
MGFRRFASGGNRTWSACQPCARGFYAQDQGSPYCIACAPGLVSSAEGASTCLSCPGHSRPNLERTECECEAGYYMNRQDRSCVSCPEGASCTVASLTIETLKMTPGLYSCLSTCGASKARAQTTRELVRSNHDQYPLALAQCL